MPKFGNTRKALEKYDSTTHARNAAWANAMTRADVDAAEHADNDALAEVRAAYYEDTREFNRPDHQCDIAFMRRMANEHN